MTGMFMQERAVVDGMKKAFECRGQSFSLCGSSIDDFSFLIFHEVGRTLNSAVNVNQGISLMYLNFD